MGVIPYLLLMCLTVILGYFVFRIQVRNDYKRKGELSLVSTVFEFLIFAGHANLPYTFFNVSWPALPALPKYKIQLAAGLSFIIVGFLVTVIAMGSLGYRKAFGQKQTSLRRSGFYRYTRNPQIIAYGVLLIGCIILWPSLYALGWFLVYSVIAHMMVLTEEEHLRSVYGSKYDKYCQHVPRYFPILL